MTTTVRAEIEIGMPGECPVALASAATDTPIEDVTRSAGLDSSGHLTEEFTIENAQEEARENDCREDPTELPGSEPVFELESHTVHRFTRDPSTDCVCALIERVGWPVSDVRAVDGSLIVSCYASDVDGLTAVISDLRERFGEIRVRQLVQSGGETDAEFFVDRGWLTDRQREVLETAYEMGYFDYPKGANASDVADELGIARSTFSEHLASAQRKYLDVLLDE